MYSFGANDTFNMCSLARTFVHTHKSLISIFIKCNQKENDQMHSSFWVCKVVFTWIARFWFLPYFPHKNPSNQWSLLNFALTVQSMLWIQWIFLLFFCIKYFKWRLCKIIVTYSLSSAITQFLPHVFIGFFFALYKLKWEREKVAIDMHAVIGEESWIQITFRWYVDMVAASM